jgi:hypothetical protein
MFCSRGERENRLRNGAICQERIAEPRGSRRVSHVARNGRLTRAAPAAKTTAPHGLRHAFCIRFQQGFFVKRVGTAIVTFE